MAALRPGCPPAFGKPKTDLRYCALTCQQKAGAPSN